MATTLASKRARLAAHPRMPPLRRERTMPSGRISAVACQFKVAGGTAWNTGIGITEPGSLTRFAVILGTDGTPRDPTTLHDIEPLPVYGSFTFAP